MFRDEGPTRPGHKNQLLAGYLALVAGFVNSAGFVLVGVFTSHVTGNAGRFADELSLGHGTAISALLLVAMFFAGAFLASMALETRLLRRREAVYGGLLVVEAALLAGAMAATDKVLEAAFLAIAMGMQNSFVTRLSGAIVRTTHLTGVVTDLGIESARWFRYWRTQVSRKMRVRLHFGEADMVRPSHVRVALLATIVVAFLVGSALGAMLALRTVRFALTVPIGLLLGGAGVAFISAAQDPRPAD